MLIIYLEDDTLPDFGFGAGAGGCTECSSVGFDSSCSSTGISSASFS
jgi:hypothetical protein